jgi:hypothetical protein
MKFFHKSETGGTHIMFAVLYRRPEYGFQGGLDARNLGVRPALRRASLGAAALALTVVLEERRSGARSGKGYFASKGADRRRGAARAFVR